jgi:uncharacterized protein YeeX (DUF496 family)
MEETKDKHAHRRLAINKLKSKFLDNISEAIDSDMSNEEIIGTIEAIKQQTTSILLDATKAKKPNGPTAGYR